MKKTKKMIYAEYGIEFDGQHINSPAGWIPPVLVDGNSKIGKGIYHFSTFPGTGIYTIQIGPFSIDVKGTCPCDCVGCYAMTGNFRYDNVKLGLAIKTYLARNYMEFIERAILAQIDADGVKFIRIHASGDFFSLEYAAMWRRIAAARPGVVFWTYTKFKAAETIFDGLENANIVRSIIPGKGKNYGTCEYILALYEYLKAAGKNVYICRCGIDDNQHCTNCRGCSINEYVLFIEHSTKYNAKKDPLYPVIKQIIENQAIPAATPAA